MSATEFVKVAKCGKTLLEHCPAYINNMDACIDCGYNSYERHFCRFDHYKKPSEYKDGTCWDCPQWVKVRCLSTEIKPQ